MTYINQSSSLNCYLSYCIEIKSHYLLAVNSIINILAFHNLPKEVNSVAVNSRNTLIKNSTDFFNKHIRIWFDTIDLRHLFAATLCGFILKQIILIQNMYSLVFEPSSTLCSRTQEINLYSSALFNNTSSEILNPHAHC